VLGVVVVAAVVELVVVLRVVVDVAVLGVVVEVAVLGVVVEVAVLGVVVDVAVVVVEVDVDGADVVVAAVVVVVAGSGGETCCVCGDVAMLVPFLLLAVSATRIVKPASAGTSGLVCEVAPATGAQALPPLEQRNHWKLYLEEGPLQPPVLAVSVCPTSG
jgi:hypothetical protein